MPIYSFPPTAAGGPAGGGASPGGAEGFSAFDDFIGSAPSPNRLGWAVAGNGAGSGVLLDAAAFAEVSPQHPGVLNATTGTTVGGRGVINTSIEMLELPAVGGRTLVEWLVRLSAIQTLTEDYFLNIGFGDNTGGGNATDGIYFRTDANAPPGNWQCVARNNGVETAVDSGVLATTAWTKLKVEIARATGDAEFYIDGVLVATIAKANLPGAGRRFGLLAKIQKQLGTTPVSMFLDYCKFELELASPR